MPGRNGMDWIRLWKRLAIYARDGFDCVWCRAVFPLSELGHGLTLDHVSDRRDNRACNLVTSCHDCNTARHTRPVDEWIPRAAERNCEEQAGIRERLEAALAGKVDPAEGKRLALLRRPKGKLM